MKPSFLSRLRSFLFSGYSDPPDCEWCGEPVDPSEAAPDMNWHKGCVRDASTSVDGGDLE